MAPQKRNTKQAKTNQRRAKVDAFLEDFDAEVKARFLHLKEQQNQLLTVIDNRYNMAIIKLPKAVRQMNWLLYFNPEQPKSPEVDNSKREEVAELENVLAENHLASPRTLQKASKKAKSSSEDENTAPQTTTKKGKSKRPPITSKKTRVQSVLGKTASTRKSTRKNLFTPARNMLDSSMMMGTTPLITPRFDPRLPKTPAVRVPHHNERVYSISGNGSPIQSRAQDIVINIPIGNGESLSVGRRPVMSPTNHSIGPESSTSRADLLRKRSIQLLASQMDSVDLSSMDETALQGLRRLQTRLTTLCG